MHRSIDNRQQSTPRTLDGRLLPRRWLAIVATVWIGFAFTSFAGMAANYATVWYVTESSGSPLELALVYVCAFLPIGLLSPLGGVVADRFNRKAIIMICDGGLALAAAVLGATLLFVQLSLAAILVFMVVFGCALAFRQPAFNATMPLMVPEKHLLRINSLDTLLSSISMICAPAFGIFLYTSIGFASVMFLDAIGAAAAVLTMFIVHVPTMRNEKNEARGVVLDLKEGARALSSNRGLLVLMLGIVIGMMAYGPLDSLLPLMVAEHFGGDGYLASLVAAVFGIGMLLGSIVLMVRGGERHLVGIIVGAASIVGGATLVAGLLPQDCFAGFVVAIGVLAMACAGFNGPLLTITQRTVSEDKLGRVMGLFSALMGLGVPLGTALGGMLAENIGVAAFFAVDGAVLLVLAVCLGLLPSVRALDETVPETSGGVRTETAEAHF
jgi:MFS transporter, DHA3 family, macrolide efflux protein